MGTGIRIKKGRKITTLSELRSYQQGLSDKPCMLLGSASNCEVVRADVALYAEAEMYGKERVYLPYEGMAAVNLIVGAMGRGKTNFLYNLILSRPDSNMIIHCPKGEYNVSFYDADKDMIVAYPDCGSVIWDVFGEIKQDRQVGDLIWRNMLGAIRGDSKEGQEWIDYACAWLAKLAGSIIDQDLPLEDIPAEIIRLYKEFKQEVGDSKTGMQSDALGTAAPVFNLLFQMYQVGVEDNRTFVTVSDMTKARRVFLCNSKQFAAQLNIVNNALLSCLINTYLSRPNITREQVERYSYFILDEYLTFKLDSESENALLTLCRSKGVSVWLGMQHLPADKSKLTGNTASRYATIVFRVDDDHTRTEIEKLTDDLEYQRKEMTMSLGSDGSMISMSGGVTLNETLVDIKTKQVPREVLSNLTAHVAFVEINDLKGRYRMFVKPPFIATIKNPCRINKAKGEEGFLYSDVARFAKRLEEVI